MSETTDPTAGERGCCSRRSPGPTCTTAGEHQGFTREEATQTEAGRIRGIILDTIASRVGQVPDLHPRLLEGIEVAARRLATPAEPDPTAGEHRALAVAEKADEMLRANHWRRGQAMFNALHEIDPALANHLRSTPADPFYRDERIGAFLDAVKAGPPTEPDAGDVEALTEDERAGLRRDILNRYYLRGINTNETGLSATVEAACDVFADRLDAVRRKAEQKALTEAADTWDRLCTRGHPLDAEVADRLVPWLRDRADRIARESR